MNSQSDVEERSSHPAYGSEHFDTVIIAVAKQASRSATT